MLNTWPLGCQVCPIEDGFLDISAHKLVAKITQVINNVSDSFSRKMLNDSKRN